MFFLQSSFCVLVIHDFGLHLEGGGVLMNSDADYPIYSLCASIKSYRYCPVMH